MSWPFHCLDTISFPIRIKATISGRFDLEVKRCSRLSAQALDLTGEGCVRSGAKSLIRGLERSQVASPLPSSPARADRARLTPVGHESSVWPHTRGLSRKPFPGEQSLPRHLPSRLMSAESRRVPSSVPGTQICWQPARWAVSWGTHSPIDKRNLTPDLCILFSPRRLLSLLSKAMKSAKNLGLQK